MDKLLKVLVQLQAVDKMSSVINAATNKSITDLDRLKKSAKDSFGSGSMMLGAGAAITASLAPAVKAYAQLEDAQTQLKVAMMDSNGNVGADFEKMAKLSEDLGNKLPGNTADFALLFETLNNNGIKSETILNGVGKAAAYLAVAIKMPYEQAGVFAAKMKEATGVADAEMMQFFDTIARVRNLGVDADEMRYAFSRSAGALKLVGLQGLEASKGVAAVYAQLIRAGMSGETVGTGFSSIMNSLLDPKKYGAMKDAAKQAGVELQFFKDGKFLGMDNMVKELDKLKGLSAGQRSGIVNALTGGGQDAAMMQTIISNGVEGLTKINAALASQANLNDKVEERLKTLSAIWEATTGTIENMFAALGEGLGPELKSISTLFGNVAGAIQQFLKANPDFTKFLTTATAGIGVLLSVVGVLKMMRGAFVMLRVVMMQNPFILFMVAAIAAAAFVYSHWGQIVKWFKSLWTTIKFVAKAAWDGIKYMFLNFTGYGLIIKHWDTIAQFFTNLWDNVKGKFMSLVSFVLGLGARFFNAGKNIVKSIWDGIKSLASKPIEAIANITKKMREFLPFSPAKQGAFKDLHRVKIVETIAGAIKPAPVVNAMARVTSAAGSAFGINGRNAPRPVFAGQGGGGGMGDINLTFSPTINGGDSASILQQIRSYVPQLANDLQREMERRQRRQY